MGEQPEATTPYDARTAAIIEELKDKYAGEQDAAKRPRAVANDILENWESIRCDVGFERLCQVIDKAIGDDTFAAQTYFGLGEALHESAEQAGSDIRREEAYEAMRLAFGKLHELHYGDWRNGGFMAPSAG